MERPSDYLVKEIGWYQTTLIAKDTKPTYVPNGARRTPNPSFLALPTKRVRSFHPSSRGVQSLGGFHGFNLAFDAVRSSDRNRNLNRRVLSRRQRHQRDADDRPRVDHRVSRAVLGPPPRDPGDPGRDVEVPSIAPEDKRPASPRAREPDRVRSIHWFPYDRVGVVNADP